MKCGAVNMIEFRARNREQITAFGNYEIGPSFQLNCSTISRHEQHFSSPGCKFE
jgi:hypothetical protein